MEDPHKTTESGIHPAPDEFTAEEIQTDYILRYFHYSHLPERLQLVLKLYFIEELNLNEIAAVLGVSVPRVHQLKADALKKARVAMVSQVE